MANLKHVVRVFAGILVVSGVFGLVMPGSVADFAGLIVEPSSTNGYVEIGAVYGGMTIALGAIALYSTLSYGAAASPMLAAVGLIFVGAAAGRLIVASLMGPGTLQIAGWLLLLFDAACAAVFLIGSRALDSEL